MLTFVEQNKSELKKAAVAGMVFIPAGETLIGCETGSEAEQPQHIVQVDAFWMDETPVTNQAFLTFVNETGYLTQSELAGSAWGFKDGTYAQVPGLSWRTYATEDRLDHPVVLVSWDDAQAFCQWAGKSLPTEAQWEKAARGDGQEVYPWGSDEPDGSQSNFASKHTEMPGTTRVRQYRPNAYGLYDLVGNVWQWCSDWYAENYYSEGERQNPLGPEAGMARVRRGGSWNVIQAFRLRVSNRGAMDPISAVPNMGFRCVKSAETMSYTDSSSEATGEPFFERAAAGQITDPRLKELETVLDSLRPAMEADGGGVQVLSLSTDGVVTVKLVGTCTVCPSAKLTLKHGIERTLSEKLPWVREVRRA